MRPPEQLAVQMVNRMQNVACVEPGHLLMVEFDLPPGKWTG